MKNLCLIFLLWITFSGVNAQDLIFLTTGDEIAAKITEITPTDIWYKKPDSLEGRTFSFSKKEVFMLKYANGAKELIKPYLPADTLAAIRRTPEQLYEQGRRDARQYYQGNGAMWASAGATLLLGLPGPILVGAIPPKIKATRVPDAHLLDSTPYRDGYRAQAHRKKIGKVAAGSGIAVGVVLVIAIGLLSAF